MGLGSLPSCTQARTVCSVIPKTRATSTRGTRRSSKALARESVDALAVLMLGLQGRKKPPRTVPVPRGGDQGRIRGGFHGSPCTVRGDFIQLYQANHVQ